MDKAMLWGFSVAMYIVVGLQWSRLLERPDPLDGLTPGDVTAWREARVQKLFRGSLFAAGLAAIIIRHWSHVG